MASFHFMQIKTTFFGKSKLLAFEPRPAGPSQIQCYNHSAINEPVLKTVQISKIRQISLMPYMFSATMCAKILFGMKLG